MKHIRKITPNLDYYTYFAAFLFFIVTGNPLTVSGLPSYFDKPLTNNSAQINEFKRSHFYGSSSPDTTKPGQVDTSVKPRIDTFSLKISKDSLDAPLKYQAEDSAVVLVKDKKIILYGKTKTDYKDITLTAPKVMLDQSTQTVTAVNKKDSAGLVVEAAHFKSGDNEFSSDTIFYNFKTQIGLTKNTYTQLQEIAVLGDILKKVTDNVTFIKRARFTTCMLDDPHFAFVADKMKVINKKLAVSGPVHPEFEGVPLPIYLPFGFYPLSQGRHSGFIAPQFTTNEQYGLGLTGMGYYKVLNDYWDTKVYGDIYSYGGWTINVNPTYRKRYRYSGAFLVTVQNTKFNFKGDPDFSDTKTYNLSWNHTVDSKARPGTTFSAHVNASSTKFNRYLPNSPTQNFQNLQQSSIAYSKTWIGKPFTLVLSANHSQNNNLHLINISLPDGSFNVNTLYPFQKKESVSSIKWYEKIGVGYNAVFRNQFAFYDTAFNFKRLIDTVQWGAQHNFPINISLPPILGGAVLVSPQVSYSQVWIAHKFIRRWDDVAKKLDTTVTKGFFMDQQASFGLNLNTALYGTFQFKGSRIIAIRHVMRPSLGFNYRPDLSAQHFYRVQVDTTGYKYEFSEFEGALYPGYSKGQTGGISFQLDNNLEMKYRSRKDTGDHAIKKLKLLEGYGFSGSYNFLKDSLKLSNISLYLRTTLFDKININAGANLDPYQTDARGNDINKYAWEKGKFKPGRITNASISVNSGFSSKPKDPKKAEDQKKLTQERLNDPNLIGDQQRLLDYMRQNPSEFVDFNIPWQFNFGFSLLYSSYIKPDYSGYTKQVNSNITLNGSFNLTPKWNLNGNGYYDFKTHKLQTLQMSISRDMHCWQLAISVTPIGLYRFFSFTISPKASVLQDLRINRTRSFPTY